MLRTPALCARVCEGPLLNGYFYIITVVQVFLHRFGKQNYIKWITLPQITSLVKTNILGTGIVT